MKKKQMMMALVSLMVLSAQAQANFQVSVSNPSKVARTDAPVVVDLSMLLTRSAQTISHYSATMRPRQFILVLVSSPT